MRGVDENRHNGLARALFCFIDKRHMAAMKRAHRGHEADRLARTPPFGEPRPETRDVMDNFKTACGAGGHELALDHAGVFIVGINGKDQSMVDIGAGSSYPVAISR